MCKTKKVEKGYIIGLITIEGNGCSIPTERSRRTYIKSEARVFIYGTLTPIAKELVPEEWTFLPWLLSSLEEGKILRPKDREAQYCSKVRCQCAQNWSLQCSY